MFVAGLNSKTALLVNVNVCMQSPLAAPSRLVARDLRAKTIGVPLNGSRHIETASVHLVLLEHQLEAKNGKNAAAALRP